MSLREAGSRFDALPFDGAVNGGAADTEQLADGANQVVSDGLAVLQVLVDHLRC